MPYRNDLSEERFDELYEERKKVNDGLPKEKVTERLEAAGYDVEALHQRFETFLSPPVPPIADRIPSRWRGLNVLNVGLVAVGAVAVGAVLLCVLIKIPILEVVREVGLDGWIPGTLGFAAN